mmetsp:Transcript_36430/g.90850  ORF Transcript_36430/g.90850 Transcript_36430/m.90850 type:complete len:220 (+) Transcript_36430:470-1129(+)
MPLQHPALAKVNRSREHGLVHDWVRVHGHEQVMVLTVNPHTVVEVSRLCRGEMYGDHFAHPGRHEAALFERCLKKWRGGHNYVHALGRRAHVSHREPLGVHPADPITAEVHHGGRHCQAGVASNFGVYTIEHRVGNLDRRGGVRHKLHRRAWQRGHRRHVYLLRALPVRFSPLAPHLSVAPRHPAGCHTQIKELSLSFIQKPCRECALASLSLLVPEVF